MDFKKHNGVYAPYYYKARKEQKQQEVKDLFAKYQKPLVTGLNHWALGTPFRKLLGIDKECKDKIFKLTDNSYHTRLGKKKFKAVIRGYPVFAKRIGVALSKWDIVRDYITRNPKLYQGLDEYRGLLAQIGLLNTREFPTVMAASGDPIYAGAGDGYVGVKVVATWAGARGATTGVVGHTTESAYVRAIQYSSQFYISRLFFPFDTSGLGSIIVSAAVFSAYCSAYASDPEPVVAVQTSQASTSKLVSDDFNNLAFTAGSNTQTVQSTGWKTFTLTETGRGWVSGTAWTKLGIIDNNHDLLNATPPEEAAPTDNATFRFSEYADVTSDPKLVVTYTSGSPSPSVSVSATPSISVSLSLSPSPSASISASPSISASVSISLSPSISESLSLSPSPSVSESLSPSVSASISISASPSISESVSLSPSPSVSESLSISVSISLSPSVSASVSVSLSPSVSVSKSPSVSASVSESATPSISPSISESATPSISASVSESATPSVSESATPSVSISLSPSVSESYSTSPSSSASVSVSLSPSISISATPSISISASPSISASVSESATPSISVSLSKSPSPSVSISATPSVSASVSVSLSDSPSPSEGYTGYTKGDYAALPADDTDLENDYTGQEVTDVASKNDVRVDQTGTLEHMIHQYKDFVGSQDSCILEWEGQSSLAPSSSTIYLQIYNQDTTTWVTVDTDGISNADTDFSLLASIADLTDYKDASNVISSRIYQEAL